MFNARKEDNTCQLIEYNMLFQMKLKQPNVVAQM